MNLLRLLSAGRSLVGLKDSTARYRMSDPKAMPKFGSGNNPFWAKREVQGKAEPRAPLPSAAPACRSERETESAAKGRVLRYRSSVVAGVARWRANLSLVAATPTLEAAKAGDSAVPKSRAPRRAVLGQHQSGPQRFERCRFGIGPGEGVSGSTGGPGANDRSCRAVFSSS